MATLSVPGRTKMLHTAVRFYTAYWFRMQSLVGRRVVSPPHAKSWNGVLQTAEEWKSAVAQMRGLGLRLHPDGPKNWDTLIALDAIIQNANPDAYVLDAGTELYSSLLPCLYLYGYRNLYGINLAFNRSISRGPIRYSYGNVMDTRFAPESFDAVTCLSVMEHGVDPESYLKEMSRVLKPGGLLITSTDYWEHGVDTTGLMEYGVPVKIFTSSDISELIDIARDYRLELTGELDLGCQERSVTWKRLGLSYTFVAFTLRKIS